MQKKKVNILFSAKADFSEVVDSISDVFKVGITIEKALKDGFQLNDLFQFLALEPVVMEIINDMPEFLNQFMALNPDTSKAAVVAARDKVVQENGPLGKVSGWIFSALYNLASGFAFALVTKESAEVQIDLWKTLASGGNTIPEGLIVVGK